PSQDNSEPTSLMTPQCSHSHPGTTTRPQAYSGVLTNLDARRTEIQQRLVTEPTTRRCRSSEASLIDKLKRQWAGDRDGRRNRPDFEVASGQEAVATGTAKYRSTEWRAKAAWLSIETSNRHK